MKTIRFALSLLSLWLLPTVVAANLLVNPEFADNGSGWRVPNWLPDLIQPEFSSGALTMEVTRNHPGYCFQDIKPTPEIDCYRFRVEVAAADPATPLLAGLSVECTLSGDAGEEYRYYSGQVVGHRNNRDIIELTLTPPEKTIRMRLALEAQLKDEAADNATGRVSFHNPEVTIGVLPGICRLLRVRPAWNHSVYRRGEALRFLVDFANGTGERVEVPLAWTLTDFFDRIAASGVTRLTLEPETLQSEELTLTLPEQASNGFYALKLQWTKDDGVTDTAIQSAVVFNEIVGKRNPFFSISLFYMTPEYADAFAHMGGGSVGVGITRKLVESVPGHYDFTELDRLVQAYHDAGLEVDANWYIITFGYEDPEWLRTKLLARHERGENPFDDEYYDGFRQFVRAVVEQRGELFQDWAIINEIDLRRHFNEYERPHYIRCCKIISEEIRQRFPDAPIGGFGTSGADFNAVPRFPEIRELLPELAGFLNGLYLDAYITPCLFGPGHTPIGEENGKLRDGLLEAVRLAREYGFERVAIEEKGYKIMSHLPPDSTYGKDLAATLARGYIVALSVPQVIRWSYFLIHTASDGDGSDYGLFQNDAPRPAVAGYGAIARFLQNAQFYAEVLPVNGIYTYVFTEGDHSLAALWSTHPEPVEVTLSLPGNWQLADMMNHPIQSGNTEPISLVLDSYPRYLTAACRPEQLQAALARLQCRLPEVAIQLHPLSENQVGVTIRNQTSQELPIRIQFQAEHTDTTLLPEELREVAFPAPPGGASGKFSAVVTTERQSYRQDTEIELFPVPLLPEARLTGDLKMFDTIEPLRLATTAHLQPTDAAPNRLWTGPEDLSVQIYTGYDAEFFYFGAAVKDDQVRNQLRQSREIWTQDAIQLAFDPENDARNSQLQKPGYGNDDCEFGLALGSIGAEIFTYYGHASSRIPELRITNSDDGILYEAAIPWEAIGLKRVIPGTVFGFNVSVLDSDDGNWPIYWMQLTPGIVGSKDPGLFQRFILR